MKSVLRTTIAIGGLTMGLAGQASAHLTGPVTMDFQGAGNIMPAAVGPTSPDKEYVQNGIFHTAVGFAAGPGDFTNSTPAGSHVHGALNNTGTPTQVTQLEADSGGGLFTLQGNVAFDFGLSQFGDYNTATAEAFSFVSADVPTLQLRHLAPGFPPTLDPNNKANLTIRGYTSADLSQSFDFVIEEGDVAPGTLGYNFINQDSRFESVYLVEYFFDGDGVNTDGPGRGNNPTSNSAWGQLLVEFNNVNFDAAPASAVPVPAAVWLFGTGLVGLLGIGRRQAA